MCRFNKILLLAITVNTTVLPSISLAAEENLPYSAVLSELGQARFAAVCGFCHGMDASGGSKGLDLIQSELVANDVNGSLISVVVRRGRPNTEMPAFNSAVVSDSDLEAIVAFIHNQRFLDSKLIGGRRSVEPEDVAIGSAVAGKNYFQNNCSDCHSADGDLSGIGSRLQGLPLMMRMLYPGSEVRGGPNPPAQVEVKTGSGENLKGSLVYQDEFTLALYDRNGVYHSWLISDIDFILDNHLQGHIDQLSRYTDTDMHNVLAYLLSLQ